MILFKPRPPHPICELLDLFQTLVIACSYLLSSDPDGQPKLSPDQRKKSCIWKRPNQIRGQSMDILSQDVLQHIVTDCSVCASISVCLEHSRRFGSNVSLSNFIRSSRLTITRSLQYHPYLIPNTPLLKWMADMIFAFCSMVHGVE